MLERGWPRRLRRERRCCSPTRRTPGGQFIRQRQRWSRGLIEAFKAHWRLLFKRRMTTLFIWWNLLFPYLDLAYTLRVRARAGAGAVRHLLDRRADDAAAAAAGAAGELPDVPRAVAACSSSRG
ncbi:MAG: hypothetical protein MZW92_73420 [Comamonadaceae bacterium]|nr:hypothetical protein [Comamonadaceae bacterium]